MSAGKNKRSMKVFQEISLPIFIFACSGGHLIGFCFCHLVALKAEYAKALSCDFFWDAEIVRACCAT
jgi:hypothetical protein